ncbi:MAG: helix-turn-helix domain-containing protein [Opitutaceae bacterium]|jgi:hypothetical protein
MVYPKIRRLIAARKKLAQLEQAVASELPRELAGLYERYNFSDVESFLAAVRSAAGGRKGGRGPGPSKKAAAAPKAKKRRRAKITDAVRGRVKKLVKAGKSGSRIAKEVGISLPSVQNIKKALGLVKGRGSKPKKVRAKRKPAKKRPAKIAPAKQAPSAPPPPPPAPAATAGR